MADSIQEMYKKARAAFETVEFWDQDRVDEMCAAVGWELQKEETAMELARRKGDPSPHLITMLAEPDLYTRLGACQALIMLKDRAASAVERRHTGVHHAPDPGG